ncbi:hypothetical protein Efla_002954 [Eimeria flavescens]
MEKRNKKPHLFANTIAAAAAAAAGRAGPAHWLHAFLLRSLLLKVHVKKSEKRRVTTKCHFSRQAGRSSNLPGLIAVSAAAAAAAATAAAAAAAAVATAAVADRVSAEGSWKPSSSSGSSSSSSERRSQSSSSRQQRLLPASYPSQGQQPACVAAGLPPSSTSNGRSTCSSSSSSSASSMSDFKLREEELAGAPTIDEVVDEVAADLGLSRESHLEVKLRLRQAYIRSIPVSLHCLSFLVCKRSCAKRMQSNVTWQRISR